MDRLDKLFDNFASALNAETFSVTKDYNEKILADYYEILEALTSSYENYKKYIARFLASLEKNDAKSFTYSLFVFHLLYEKLAKLEVKTMNFQVVNSKLSASTQKKYFDLLEAALSSNNRPRFSDFKEFKTDNLTEKEISEMMSVIVDLVEEKTKITELVADDVDTFSMQIAILRELSKKNNNQIFFYFVVGQFIERLVTSELNQNARNVAEEVILCSFDDNLTEYGFYESFQCYAAQRSTHSALLYANLSLFCFINKGKLIYDRFSVQFLATSIKYFRNIGAVETAVDFYKRSKKMHVSAYDRQSIDHIYFTCLITLINKKACPELLDYLNTERENLLKAGSHTATPWLILLYNLKRISPEDFLNPNELEFYLKSFEYMVPREVKEKYSQILFGTHSELKNHLKQSLIRLSETLYKSDFHYDNEKGLILSQRLIRESHLAKDAEGFLLAMILKSDFSLIFKSKETDEFSNLKMPELNLKEFYKAFPEVYVSFTSHSKNQFIKNYIWLANSENKFYQLNLVNGEYSFSEMNAWEREKYGSLLGSDYFHSLAFEVTKKDKQGVYQITFEEYKDQTGSIIQNIKFAKLNISDKVKAVCLVKDMELTSFPHTLFLNNQEEFVHLTLPMTNIISSEWYLRDIKRPYGTGFTKGIWIPIEAGDLTIGRLYDSIENTLNEHKFKIDPKQELAGPLSETLNIICSHGDRDIAQKQVLYPSEKPINNIEMYIGTGDILVFFVCHSGSYAPSFLKNNISSIVKTCIAKGYRAVIAPFWALNVDIPALWLPEFLNQMESGNSIDIAVFKANQKVHSQYPHPAAWAAMHLYGNPHLHYKT